ncbi:hypothetical protein AGOR_G00236970 [Albula goreensis]|uniref:Neurocan core protein n=1 Tax=Albula goreensis TaxID=1534307 RepID=A0A8T3CFJ6_9TELE|nr:hypothetical protein AGOR_G00236970 [Albula goreensis]
MPPWLWPAYGPVTRACTGVRSQRARTWNRTPYRWRSKGWCSTTAPFAAAMPSPSRTPSSPAGRTPPRIATPGQLLASFNDGYDNCDAGWLSDQTVRYAVQFPGPGCYGDGEDSPGVRSYGTRDAGELFDAYCFAEQMQGEVFFSSVHQKLTLSSASTHCQSLGGRLATTGQLFLAWQAGLDQCDPGWLADGSVRYPINQPQPDCGGDKPGVRTLYRNPNGTGYHDTSALFDAYCYREKKAGVQPAHSMWLPQSITLETRHVSNTNAPERSRPTLRSNPVGQEGAFNSGMSGSPSGTSGGLVTVGTQSGGSSVNRSETPSPAPHEPQGPAPRSLTTPPQRPAEDETMSGGRSASSVPAPSALGAQYGDTRVPGLLGSLARPWRYWTKGSPTGANREESKAPPGLGAQAHEQAPQDGVLMETESIEGRATRHPSAGSSVGLDKEVAEPSPASPSTPQTTTLQGSIGFGGGQTASPDRASRKSVGSSGAESVPVWMPVPGGGSDRADRPVNVSEPGLDVPVGDASLPGIDLQWGPSSSQGGAGTGAEVPVSADGSSSRLGDPGSSAPGARAGPVGVTMNPFPKQEIPSSAMTTTNRVLDSQKANMKSQTRDENVNQSGPETFIRNQINPKMAAANTQPPVPGAELTSKIAPVSESHRDDPLVHIAVSNTSPLFPSDAPGPTVPDLTSGGRPTLHTDQLPKSTGKEQPHAVELSTSNSSWSPAPENNACRSNPCQNGGTCIEKTDSFICLCLASYGGATCDKDTEGCERGWKKFHGHCYRYFTHRHTWEDAEKDCREHGGHLASVHTTAEQDFLNGLGHENSWIGLNDRTVEEDFQWTDSTELEFENWRENQPDNFFAGGEDCVVMVAHEGGKWNDVPCNYNLPYTCKKATVLCGPPPSVDNAFLIGRKQARYDVHSVVRYQCAEGFHQRHAATAKCRANGRWDTPKMVCTKSRRPHRYRRHHHRARRERRKHKRHGPGGHQGGAEGHAHL